MNNIYVENQLREVDLSWNVMPISECIMRLLREDPDLNLLDIETAFRAIGSKTTYLVAMPKAMITPERKVKAVHLSGAPADYALWICLNGPDDLLKTLSSFGLTREQNLDALRVCGVMATTKEWPV